MKALAVALLVLAAGAADDLVSYKAMPLRLKVPGAWNHNVMDDGTHKFVAPNGESFIELNVGKVQSADMKAETCVSKIKDGIGGEFKTLKVGGQPAATKSDLDRDEKNVEFVTDTYVGCDGKTTWSLQFHYPKTKAARYAPLGKQIGESVTYLKSEK